MRTLKNLRGEEFQPSSGRESRTIDTAKATTFNNKGAASLRAVKLKPARDVTPVAAVDVSSISVGETTEGAVIAVRGAVVHKHGPRYHYVRLGPFPFHITEQNKYEIYRLFRRDLCESETLAFQQLTMAPDTVRLQTRMASVLEKWLQTSLGLSLHNNLILWDGSLTAGTPGTPVHFLKRLLETARKNKNTVLAFSKFTRLRLWGRHFSDLLREHQPPCVFPIEEPLTRRGSMTQLGRIYIAKLGRQVFRLDVDREVSVEQAVVAVERLIGNDLLVGGYPETLRLAHILCTFTANEVVGIQRYLARRFKLKMIVRPNVRRVLFGPFGKGPES